MRNAILASLVQPPLNIHTLDFEHKLYPIEPRFIYSKYLWEKFARQSNGCIQTKKALHSAETAVGVWEWRFKLLR